MTLHDAHKRLNNMIGYRVRELARMKDDANNRYWIDKARIELAVLKRVRTAWSWR